MHRYLLLKTSLISCNCLQRKKKFNRKKKQPKAWCPPRQCPVLEEVMKKEVLMRCHGASRGRCSGSV